MPMGQAPNSPLGASPGYQWDQGAVNQWGQMGQNATQFGQQHALNQGDLALRQKSEADQYGLAEQQRADKNARWGAINGSIQRQLSGGGVAAAPQVGTGPVYSNSQIQSQVNATRANNDAATAGQVHNMNQSMASHGYAGGSPLAAELAGQAQGQNLATNTSAENQLRFNAAGANANYAQQGQIANAQSAVGMQNAANNRFGSIMSALAGIV